MADRYVPRSGDDYAEAFENLFPTGPAWPRDEETVFQRVIRALAQIFGYVDQRAGVLLNVESDPRRTFEVLEEWERAYGLPDPCVPRPLSITERRVALVERITTQGGQSRAFFISLAAALGYEITITEFVPFQFGLSGFGYPRGNLMPPQARFYWRVSVSGPRVTRFRFGVSSAGHDRFLSILRAEDLECVITRFKPAHTTLQFDYLGV